MTRENDTTRRWIETTISFVIIRKTKVNAR